MPILIHKVKKYDIYNKDDLIRCLNASRLSEKNFIKSLATGKSIKLNTATGGEIYITIRYSPTTAENELGNENEFKKFLENDLKIGQKEGLTHWGVKIVREKALRKLKKALEGKL